MLQELINNFHADPDILWGLKCLVVVIFILIGAYSIEHYFKPKSALEELLEQIGLDEKVRTEFGNFSNYKHPCKAGSWR